MWQALHLDKAREPTEGLKHTLRRPNTQTPLDDDRDRPSVDHPSTCTSCRREAADPVPNLRVTFLTSLQADESCLN